jgi:hypothetical protein
MLLFIVGVLFGLSVGFHVGFYYKWIIESVTKLLDREPEQESKVINPLPPGYSDVTATSAIITPKSPDQVDREEQERMSHLV